MKFSILDYLFKEDKHEYEKRKLDEITFKSTMNKIEPNNLEESLIIIKKTNFSKNKKDEEIDQEINQILIEKYKNNYKGLINSIRIYPQDNYEEVFFSFKKLNAQYFPHIEDHLYPTGKFLAEINKKMRRLEIYDPEKEEIQKYSQMNEFDKAMRKRNNY